MDKAAVAPARRGLRVLDSLWGALLYIMAVAAIAVAVVGLVHSDWTRVRGAAILLLLEVVPFWARWTRRHPRESN